MTFHLSMSRRKRVTKTSLLSTRPQQVGNMDGWGFPVTNKLQTSRYNGKSALSSSKKRAKGLRFETVQRMIV